MVSLAALALIALVAVLGRASTGHQLSAAIDAIKAENPC